MMEEQNPETQWTAGLMKKEEEEKSHKKVKDNTLLMVRYNSICIVL